MPGGTWDPSKGITFATTAEPPVCPPKKRIVFAENIGTALTSLHERSRRQKLPGCLPNSIRRAASEKGMSYHTTTLPIVSSSSLLSKPFPNYFRPADKKPPPAVTKKVEFRTVKETKSKPASNKPAPNSTQSNQCKAKSAAPLRDCLAPKSTISRPRRTNVKILTNKPCYTAEATALSPTRHVESEVDRQTMKSTIIHHQSRLVESLHPSQRIDKASGPRILNLDLIKNAAEDRQWGIESVVDLLWERKILVQYHMRNLFEPSKMGWIEFKKCFMSACDHGESHVNERLKGMAGEIELIQEDFCRTSHRLRTFHLFRLYMDHFNQMTSEGQYILLRDIRTQTFMEPFQLCEDLNQVIYSYLSKYWEFLPKSKFFRSEGFKELRSLVGHSHKEPCLSIQDWHGLCNHFFVPQLGRYCQVATTNHLNVTTQCASMTLALCEAEECIATAWNSRETTEYKTEQYRANHITRKLRSFCEELRSISNSYVKLVVKNSIDNHLYWRAPKGRPSVISRARYFSTTQTTSVKQALPSSVQEAIVAAPFSGSALEHIGQSFENVWEPASDEGAVPAGGSNVAAEYSCILSQPLNQLSVIQSRYNDHQRTEVRPILDQSSGILNTTSFIEASSERFHQQPRASLSYQIPDSKLGEAMLASRSTAAAYWRYSLYENETGKKVKVHYCKSKETTERTAQLFLGKEVIGFDIEWKPQAQTTDGIKKNLSLVQIASEERIALFHIARYAKGDTIDDLLAPTLKQIMESNTITKVGVAIKSDCTRMRKFLGINAQGIFELSHLYKLIKYSAGDVKKIDKKLVGLARQVEEHLQLPLWKGEVRSSDWSQDLSYEQIQYAASDSYAGFQLYHTLERKRRLLKPAPPRPEHAELNIPIRLADGQTVTTTDELQDTNEGAADEIELPTPSVEKMARDFLNIPRENSKSKQKPNKHNRPESLPKAPEVVMADEWVREWRSARSPENQPQATPAYLRAYSLWHHQEYDIAEAARLLRNPPLQISTLCGYILEAIRIESLPFEAERLRSVIGHLPELALRGKYQALRRQVQ